MAKTLQATNLSQTWNDQLWNYADWNVAYAGFALGPIYGVYILRFDVPEFQGMSQGVNIDLAMLNGIGTDVTLHWALCTSDENRNDYLNTTSEVEDANQIATGIVTFNGINSEVQKKTAFLKTGKIDGGNTYYLFLWTYDQTGIAIKSINDYGNSVFIKYYQGIVRVKTNGLVKPYTVFVKYGDEVKQMIPYVKTQYGIRPGG